MDESIFNEMLVIFVSAHTFIGMARLSAVISATHIFPVFFIKLLLLFRLSLQISRTYRPTPDICFQTFFT